ncbi:MAG TPA: ATPase, T2SS/T4P/T4SS family, partial [Nitrospiria bacterium]|nr:ATPase, T2SS/T4P/T4SS family [Nitrospiria bacterium]
MLAQLIDRIERLREASTQYTAALGLDAPVSLVDVDWLVKVSDLLTESPGPNLNWITRSDLESIVAEAKYYKELFNVYREKKSIIEDRYNPAFFELPEGITSQIKYEWSNTSKFLAPGDPLGIEMLKQRRELLQFVRETKGLIQEWLREVNDIAQLMGLPIRDLTLDRIKQIAQLSLLCHSEERPDPSWLDPLRLQQTREILPGVKNEYTKYNIQKQKLMELYDESFLNLELERLTEQFSGIYQTIFRWFLPGYYKDKRAIVRTTRTGLIPPSLREDLLSARELLRLHHRLQSEFNYISSSLGQHYKGYATDFELIEHCLSVAAKTIELAGVAEMPKELVEAISIGKLPPSDLWTIGTRLLMSIEQWEKTAQRLAPLVQSQKFAPTGSQGCPSLLLELGQWSDDIEIPLANLCNLLDKVFATCSGKTPCDFPAVIKDLESLDELRVLLGYIADESNHLRKSFGTGDFPAITKDLESLDELRFLLGNIADESNHLRKSIGTSYYGINTRWNDLLAVLDWVCQLLKLFGSRPIPTQLASLASRGTDAIPSNNELSQAYLLAKELVESFESSLEPRKPAFGRPVFLKKTDDNLKNNLKSQEIPPQESLGKQLPLKLPSLEEGLVERRIISPVETERIRKFQEEDQSPPDDNLKSNLKSQEIPPQEGLRKQLPFNYLSLEERLIERGIISAEERERILKLKEEGQAPLLRLLIELGFVSEENLLIQVSDFLGIPLASLNDFPSISLPLEPFSDTVNFLKYNRIVPLKMEGKDLIVATTDPTLLSPLHAIEVLTGLKVKPVLAREKEIAARIEELFGNSTSFKPEGGTSPDREIEEMVNEGDLEHLRDMASEVPVIRIVNQMISRALETRASDIHIEPFEDQVKVRYRIDGVLHEVDPPPRHFSAAIISRFKILAQLDIAERRLPQDGRIKTKIAGKDLDMRIATIPTLYGESVVVRLLERSQIFADLGSLGFSQ